MGYSVEERGRFLGDIASVVGMSEMEDALEKMPYPALNEFLEIGQTMNAVQVQREIRICLASFGKKLKPSVIESMEALATALSKSRRNEATLVG